jgi:hypothetical protein
VGREGGEKRGRKGLIIDGVLQGRICSVVWYACYRVIQRGIRRGARLDNYTSRLRPAMLSRARLCLFRVLLITCNAIATTEMRRR